MLRSYCQKEKKQLNAKRIQATPANSSKYVLWLILAIFNDVIINKKTPKDCSMHSGYEVTFFPSLQIFQNKAQFFYYQIFKKIIKN
jgi:hypothetical protein